MDRTPLYPYLPPSRESWETLTFFWQLMPIFFSAQFVTDWYPMGKTSIDSRWNIPGKIAWMTMEVPGFVTLLYIMFTLPEINHMEQVPIGNWLMAALFTFHYIYRAIVSPLINPSMSPIHPLVWFWALAFQLCNATCIGGWLAGYGPTTRQDWAGRVFVAEVGMMIFGFGLLANMYHDDELREIRRAAARKQEKQSPGTKKNDGRGVEKVYMIPKNGLFRAVLYPHYLFEWIEWGGWWMVGGLNCVPARIFFINEITSMLPRALNGHKWYLEKFGKEKVGGRKAVIPGIL